MKYQNPALRKMAARAIIRHTSATQFYTKIEPVAERLRLSVPQTRRLLGAMAADGWTYYGKRVYGLRGIGYGLFKPDAFSGAGTILPTRSPAPAAR